MMKKYLLTISIAIFIAAFSIIAGGFYGLIVTLILTIPATIFKLEEIKEEEESKNKIPIWLYLKTTNNKED